MAEEQNTQEQAVDATPADNGGEESIPVSALADRLERKARSVRREILERLGLETEDDLQNIVTSYRDEQEARKSELEKAQERAEAAERARQEALSEARQIALEAEFKTQAALAGAAHPEDAMALAGDIEQYIDDNGRPAGVADAVKALIEQNRLPVSGRPQAPSLDGGAGGRSRGGAKTPKLTEAQIAVARRMNMTPEEYAEFLPQE